VSPGPGHGNPVRRRAIIFLSWRLAAAAAAAAGGGARVRACVHARSNARKTPPRPGQRQKPVPLVPTAGAAPPRVKRQEWAWIPVTPSPAAHLRTHAAACMTGRAATATRPVTGAAPSLCRPTTRARPSAGPCRRRTPHVQFSDPIVMDPGCCMQCPAAAALRCVHKGRGHPPNPLPSKLPSQPRELSLCRCNGYDDAVRRLMRCWTRQAVGVLQDDGPSLARSSLMMA
jgi:hypothetical protein